MIVVSDTSCMSNLLLINQLDLLQKISLSPPKCIDAGDEETIDLAIHLKANRLLIDERKGTILAHESGITTIGLLGVFVIAKENNFG